MAVVVFLDFALARAIPVDYIHIDRFPFGNLEEFRYDAHGLAFPSRALRLGLSSVGISAFGELVL